MLEGIGGLPSRVLALLVLAWLLRITVLMA